MTIKAKQQLRDYLRHHAFIYTTQSGKHNLLDFVPKPERLVDSIMTTVEKIVKED